MPQKQTFSNVAPIAPPAQSQTFTDVAPIDGAAQEKNPGAVDLKDATTIPNARIRNLPNPSDPNASPMWNLYEGAKTGAELASLPAVLGQPVASVARGLAGSIAGSFAGKTAAKVAGGGDRAQEVAGDIGAVGGGALGDVVGTSRVGRVGGKVVKGTLEDIPGVRQAGKLAQYWKETAPAPTPSAPQPAPFPEAPDPALLKARSLFEGSSSPPDPAAGLGTLKQPGQAGSIAASMQKPAAAEVAPGFQRGSLQGLLDKSLGAKQLDPKVPLRNQMDIATPTAKPAAPSADVPEGHTPVQSTALKSYKYDSGASEFHAKYGSADNIVHVFGDVTPEEAQAFDAAKSKGQAMQQIKSSHPLVAKIVNGKRIAVKASATQ